MSLHIFNSINKSWNMYANTLSSISGDHLTIKPHDGRNISLEVSGNNNIFIKQGDTSFNLVNLITGTGLGAGTSVSGSDASFNNIDVSGNVNPLIVNSAINSQLDAPNSTITQFGQDIFGEATNTYSGYNVSLSEDGTIIGITAPYNNGTGTLQGSARIYKYNDVSWVQLGQDIDGEANNDVQAIIKLSKDGTIAALGSWFNSGIGSIRVFKYNDISWIQQGQDIDGTAADDEFGRSISLSANGKIIAIGATHNDTSYYNAGQVLVYSYNDVSWNKIGTFNGFYEEAYTGFSVSLSSSGTTLAISTLPPEAALETLLPRVDIYELSNNAWTTKGPTIYSPYASNSGSGRYGRIIELSSDGTIVAINDRFMQNTNYGRVLVYKYTSSDNSWNRLGSDISGPVVTSNEDLDPYIALSADGTIIALGYVSDSDFKGLVRLYKFINNNWIQIGTTDLSGDNVEDRFGFSIALSSNGSILAIGSVFNPPNNIGRVRTYNVNYAYTNSSISTSSSASLGLVTKKWSSAYLSNIYGETINSSGSLTINSALLTLSGELLTRGNFNPLNNVSSSLGSSTKTWANAYIRDLSVGSIEVSGNITPALDNSFNISSSLKRWKNIFVDDLSINKINGQVYTTGGTSIVLTSISGNIIPSINNVFKLGDISRNWSNAYINDLSVASIELSGNLNPLSISSLGLSTRMWGNAYISDVSVTNVDVSGSLNPATNSSLGLSTKIWRNAYIRDVSVTNIELSGNLNPLIANNSSLGSSAKIWGNAYIRDVSVSNVDLSGNLIPFANSSLGLTARRWGNSYISDISVTNVELSGNLNPLISNNSSLGLSTRNWGNSYITDLSVTNVDLSGNLIPAIAAGGGSNNSTGGTITTSGAYRIHSFTTTGTSTFRPSFSGSVEVLIVGGGGGGGSSLGGGGGGGGVIWMPSVNVSADTSYSIVVGAGGAYETNGQNSTAFGAIGAGGGTSGVINSNGTNGGSGGGAGSSNSGVLEVGGLSSGNSLGTNSGTIYGNRGGNITVGQSTNRLKGAGGGGAGGQGFDTDTNTIGDGGQTGAGSGGVGITNAILGTSYYWAGGGGSGGHISQFGGWGGLGGGGGGAGEGGAGTGGGSALTNGSNGTMASNANGGAGGANTGGGGGAGNYNGGLGGTGGSGIVVIRYLQASAPVNNSSLGLSTRIWGNAYIRDVSAANIDLSGNLNPLITNNLSLGSSLKRWTNVFVDDIILNKINGQVYSAGGGGGSTVLTSVASNVVPSTTNTYSLGTTTNYWSNAYIRDLKVSNRAYQEISGDISWSAVNGYYGLTKDAYPKASYPAITRSPMTMAETAVKTWTSRTASVGNWRSVCWSPELGIFVAVGYLGSVITSPNGITWTSRSPPSGGWICVCWSPQRLLFVAISESGTNRVMTSPDGTTWTARSIPTGENSNAWFSVCWSPQLAIFVAVSYNGTNRVLYSSHGITWTAVFIGTDAAVIGVCWSPERSLFVAVADITNGGSIVVKTSPDGTTWTSRTAPELGGWRNVCWSPELGIFAAVALSGTNRIMTSPDGITWTGYIAPANVSWLNISWSAELRLFAAISRTNNAMTSPDGKNWTLRSIPNEDWWGICWSKELGIFVAVARDLVPVITSTPITHWTSRTIPEANQWLSVCWSPQLGLFVAISDNGSNRVMTSPNGITWTARSASEASGWHSVCWSPELRIFVAVAYSGTNRVMTSLDGTTWTSRSIPEANSWIRVCWSPELGLFVAVAQSGTNRVMTSPNGTTWTARTASEANGWRNVCWSPELGLFVAVAESGTNRVMTSNNGTSWTARTAAAENGWAGVCWSPELGLFVAVAQSGTNRVMTSPDGITWTARLITELNGWNTICWSRELGLFVALAASGYNRVMTSPDGINWTARLASEYNQWVCICWSPELGIAVATSYDGTNRVMTSSLKGRPPTSYNVFDSTFNSIDETGKWTFSNVAATTLSVTGTFTNTSDDRIKHNEVVISNGLAVIDQLCPKFYQKTQDMLDASYNGDLSGLAWTYEAGLIAQEVLQIPDLSFAVCGGDYYQASYILKSQINDPSYILNSQINDPSINDTSINNYDITYSLVKQVYGLNYNSIYVYGLAAIKELHAKVKAQETIIQNRQAIINSLMLRIEALDPSNQTIQDYISMYIGQRPPINTISNQLMHYDISGLSSN